ncbi:MAG: DUF11 domain-containing protein [Chloroflexi bacterium]|nr:DUF11 domain-containing protein [Chloroflexota bacterium]
MHVVVVLAGTIGTFLITVKNEGPNVAHNVKLYNGAPQGSKLRRVFGTAANCPPATLVVCTLGTLNVNQSKQVTVEVIVDANQMAPITHQARAVADEGDPYWRNNGDDQTQDLKVTWAPDLSVGMTSSAAQVGLNQDVTYTVTTYNDGMIGVSNAIVRFKIPDGMTYQSTTGTNCSYNAASLVLECWLGAFGVGAGPSLNVVARPTRTGAFSTAAVIWADQPERDPNNNGAQVSIQAAPSVDLSASSSASAGTVAIGDQVTYSVAISNAAQASSTASRVQLSGTLQTGTRFVSAVGGSCLAHADRTLSCDVESIAPGQTRTVAITAVLGPVGSITQQFSVVSLEADLNVSNNASSIQNMVVARSCSPRPNVRLSVQPAGPDSVYVNVIPNATSDAPANQVSVLRFGTPNPIVNAVVDANGLAEQSSAFATTFQRSAQTASARFTVRRVTPGQATTVPFVVEDDCGAWTTFVGAGPNAWGSVLSVMPIGGPTAPRVGTPMTYTLQARNDGPLDVEKAMVVNTIPEGTSLVSVSASQGTCTPGTTIQCNLGRLDPNGTATVTFTVNPTTAGETANWTYVTSGLHDAPSGGSLVLPAYVNPASGTPDVLPGQRTAPTPSGTPAAFPGARPNDPATGQPSGLPGSR